MDTNKEILRSDGRVVGIGEVLWDLFPAGRKIGGAPANFAYHVCQLGFPGCVVSAVGNDAWGDAICEDFSTKGLHSFLSRVSYPTGTVAVTLDAAGKPQYEICQNVAWDNIPFTPQLEALGSHTRVVCFGSLAQRHPVSRETIGRFLDLIPDDENHYKIFDINLRQHFYTEEVICDSLCRCNILKINDEELYGIGKMFGMESLGAEERCQVLLERWNLRMIILTCGEKGSYIFTPAGQSFVETPRVVLADTVGAGDSFTGAFVAGLLSGHPVEHAHRLAVDVSAYVCTQHGAMPRLPENLLGRLR